MNNYLNKGSLIGIEGRLEVYSRQEEGRYENRTNVQVSNITFLESRNQSEQRTNSENYNNQSSTPQAEEFFHGFESWKSEELPDLSRKKPLDSNWPL